MDALHENINDYTHSGSKPCKQAAAGEIPIGVSFAFRGAQSKAEGAPIDIIVPSEGVGWDSESMAMMAGTDKEDAVKVLMDWAITKPAMELYNEGYAVVAMPGVAKPVEFFPDGIVEAMIKNDFEWAGANRQRILEEWTKRYDSKSEPKG
jgi:iron(III) transport system substrate-binding protein